MKTSFRRQTLLSIPLSAVALILLDRLEALGKLPWDSRAVQDIRKWLREDRKREWDKLRQLMSARQTRFDLDLDGGLLL